MKGTRAYPDAVLIPNPASPPPPTAKRGQEPGPPPPRFLGGRGTRATAGVLPSPTSKKKLLTALTTPCKLPEGASLKMGGLEDTPKASSPSQKSGDSGGASTFAKHLPERARNAWGERNSDTQKWRPGARLRRGEPVELGVPGPPGLLTPDPHPTHRLCKGFYVAMAYSAQP